MLIHYEKKSIDILLKYKIDSNYSYILIHSIILYKQCLLINKLNGNNNKYIINIEKIATIIFSFFEDIYYILNTTSNNGDVNSCDINEYNNLINACFISMSY